MATRVLSGFLYGVNRGDPLVFTASIALLTGAAAVAGYVPARRAAHIDPVEALRSE
jgi:ABC-type lipoprotein release transport system permease subunit